MVTYSIVFGVKKSAKTFIYCAGYNKKEKKNWSMSQSKLMFCVPKGLCLCET